MHKQPRTPLAGWSHTLTARPHCASGHFDLATLQPNVAGPNVLASREQQELEQIESSRQKLTSSSLTNLSAFFADSRKEIV